MGKPYNSIETFQSRSNKVLKEYDLETLLKSVDSSGKVDGYTTDEICEIVGRGPKWVRKRLKKLIEMGACDVVRCKSHDMVGRATTIYKYKFNNRGFEKNEGR